MPNRLHLELDAVSEFLVDGAGRPLEIVVDRPLKPANQRLMDSLGVRVEVVGMTATAGGVSCLIGGCDWRWDGSGDRDAAVEAHRLEEHDHIPAFKFSVRSDAGREALEAMDALFTQRELLGEVVGQGADEEDVESDNAEVPEPEPEQEVETVSSAASPTWTRESIIEAFQSFHREHGRPPTKREWTVAGSGHPSAYLIDKEFGSWANAVQAAGFARPTRGGNTLGLSRSSVREPKARETGLTSPPPAASSSPPLPEGDAVVLPESPSPGLSPEAGSHTDDYSEWLAETVGVGRLAAQLDELEARAASFLRKASALRQIIAAVTKLAALENE